MNAPPSVSSQPIPPVTEREFPNGNAIDGKAYQMANPANPLQQLVIMSMESYMKQGTIVQGLRSVAASQDRRVKELLNQIAVCQSVFCGTWVACGMNAICTTSSVGS